MGHCVHSDAPDGEKKHGLHNTQSVLDVAFVLFVYVPAGHGEHEEAPVFELYVPSWHGVHT